LDSAQSWQLNFTMKRSHQPAPFKYISINARNIEKYIAAIFIASCLLIINFQQCD
jgi:hypothetical protein